MGNWVLENRLLNNRSISKDKNTPMDLFVYYGVWIMDLQSYIQWDP